MRRLDRAHIVLAVCLWLAPQLAALAAHADAADPSRSASARALFEAGVQHADRAEWADAAASFRRALLLRDSQVIRYNLASALAELGRLVEASELLHTVQADPSTDEALRQNANALLEEVTPRIARLTIQPPSTVQGLQVELDGSALSAAQLEVPLALDPGHHVVRARAEGAAIDEQSVDLADGSSQRLFLRAPAPAAPKPVEVAPVPTPAETARAAGAPLAQPASPKHDTGSDKKSRKRRELALGLTGGALVVAAAVTVAMLFIPRGQSHDTGSAAGNFDPPSVGVNVPP